jgi:hypothetical protein
MSGSSSWMPCVPEGVQGHDDDDENLDYGQNICSR